MSTFDITVAQVRRASAALQYSQRTLNRCCSQLQQIKNIVSGLSLSEILFRLLLQNYGVLILS